MKQFVHHTTDGTIHSLVTIYGEHKFGLSLALRPGMVATEIETIKFKSETPDPIEFTEFTKSHRVPVANKPASVVKK